MSTNHLAQLSDEALAEIIRRLKRNDRDCRRDRTVIRRMMRRNKIECAATAEHLRHYTDELMRRSQVPPPPPSPNDPLAPLHGQCYRC